jgi:transposase
VRVQYAEYESEKAEGLSVEPPKALALLAGIESLGERIREYNEGIEQLAQLKQVKGMGTLIELTFPLTVEDPHRFRESRDVGWSLGLQPGRRNSGQREPHCTSAKERDSCLRAAGARHADVHQNCGQPSQRAHRRKQLSDHANPDASCNHIRRGSISVH